MRMHFSAALTLSMLITSGGMTLLPTSSAMAMPSHITCVLKTYYNNVAHDKIVGTRTQCPGTPLKSTGHSSPYFEVERVTIDQGPGGTHTGGGPGNLPCEFLQEGCSNLPVSRY